MDSVASLNTGRNALIRAAVFGGGRAKGTLKILQELLNHGGLVAVVCEQGLPTLLQSALQVQALRFESSSTTERWIMMRQSHLTTPFRTCSSNARFFLSRQSSLLPPTVTTGGIAHETHTVAFRFNTRYTRWNILRNVRHSEIIYVLSELLESTRVQIRINKVHSKIVWFTIRSKH